jgi:hypothetical protein
MIFNSGIAVECPELADQRPMTRCGDHLMRRAAPMQKA